MKKNKKPEPLLLPEPDPDVVAEFSRQFIALFDRSASHEEFVQFADQLSKRPEILLSVQNEFFFKGMDHLERSKCFHRYFVKHVLNIFQVPLGEAGVSVVPREVWLGKERIR
jgi:hypothetical protein